MKNKSIYLKIAIILAIVTILSVAMCIYVSTAETSAEDLNIAYCNLSFENDTHIMYAIKSSNSKVQLLVWTEPQAEYLLGTQKASVSPLSEQMTIDGEKYTVFKYTGVAAKQMTDNVYVRAYIDNGDGDIIYGQAHKYSILQYAYNKLGKTGEATSNQNLIDMLDSMLLYGASAQKYHGYKTDNLATDDFVQIKLSGGILADGFNHGLYKVGTTVTISAPTQSQDGAAFSQWTDKNGTAISDTSEYTLTVGNENNTYTAEYAAIPEYSVGLAYVSNGDGTCYVSGIGTCTDTDINIPPVSPEGDTVTSIGASAFSHRYRLTSVEIPNSVTIIDRSAFYECTGLTSITIPDNVNVIEAMAFYGCSGLKSINFSAGVTKIGTSAFYGCTGLTSLYITDIVAWCSIDFNADTNPLYYAQNLYLNGKLVTELVIPNEVKRIGVYAFLGCTGLTSVSIPDSVTEIGNYAFVGCTKIESIEVWKNNAKYHAEGNCLIETESKTLILGCKNSMIPNDDSVTSIGEYAFFRCPELTDITIPNNITSIGYSAFDSCTGITSINIPDSVVDIARNAFTYCSGLSSIVVDKYNSKYYSEGNCIIEKVTGNLILGCKNSIIPTDGKVNSIGTEAFNGCDGLTSINIPYSVKSIHSSAFADCTGLISVIVENGVTSISNYVFYGCNELTSIHYNATIEEWNTIEKTSFWDSNTGSYTIYCTDGTIAKDGMVTYY